jgi:UDP-N-acetylmuramate--alanine ligase
MEKHYHLIGIGGIGMSAIARLLLLRGIKVSGSDIKENKITDDLKKSGVRIFIGHNPQNIQGARSIIYSSAIKEDNPEIKLAKAEKIPLFKRAQALAELMRDKSVITVSGSHGKTTTTSLVSYLLLEGGLSPTLAIGGIFKNIENHASCGCGDFFVAEADESDGSFLYYQPKYSIITNVDREHLDFYKDFANVVKAFGEFMDRTASDGCLFLCSDDRNLNSLAKGYKKRLIRFGLKDTADIYPKNIRLQGLSSEFDCFYRNKFLSRFNLSLGGEHNISNSLSVIALGLELGLDTRVIKKVLKDYQGAGRRLEIKFKDKDYTVIDDYAHHPTEIQASLKALKNIKSDRLIVIFQPHRFSRTKLLLEDFTNSFSLADYLILTDIYPAGEPKLEGITGMTLFERLREKEPEKKIEFLAKEKITGHILKIRKPGDLIVILGAGDIAKIADELAEEFKK